MPAPRMYPRPFKNGIPTLKQILGLAPAQERGRRPKKEGDNRSEAIPTIEQLLPFIERGAASPEHLSWIPWRLDGQGHLQVGKGIATAADLNELLEECQHTAMSVLAKTNAHNSGAKRPSDDQIALQRSFAASMMGTVQRVRSSISNGLIDDALLAIFWLGRNYKNSKKKEN